MSADDPTALACLLTARGAIDAEIDERVPPIGLEELTLRVRQHRRNEPERHWVATLDGEAAGTMTASLPLDANTEQVELAPRVVAAHRGRGVGAALLRAALAALPPERTLVTAWAPAGTEGFFAAHALTPAVVERRSRLSVAELDESLLAAWADDPPARAAGYELRCWRGRCPDELLEAAGTALDAMADQPLDDLTYEIARQSPDVLRDREEAAEGILEPFWALALAPDGSPAGATFLRVNLHRPSLAEQEDTGVLPAHRGHGLGRWLKAENLRRTLDAYPQLELVTTENAESNPYMLAINEALGFRPYLTSIGYQGARAEIEASLR